MRDFDSRWRRLARAARETPEPSPPSSPVPLARLLSISHRTLPASAARQESVSSWHGWALPACALALLNVLAMPLLSEALETYAGVTLSLSSVPRPPVLPPPPVSAPPALGLPSLAQYMTSPAELKGRF